MKGFYKVLIIVMLAVLIGTPPIATGYTNLSLATAAQNNSEISFYYESAAKILPWRPDLYEQAGLYAANDPKRAIQLFTKAREAGQLSPKGRLSLGDAYLSTGQDHLAILEWQDLLDSNTLIPETSKRLAPVYHSKGQFDRETSVLRLWLKADSANPEASQRLAIILAASDSPEAVSLLETGTDNTSLPSDQINGLISALVDPSTIPAYRLARIGQALARLNEWSLAEMAFNNAVTASPAYAEAWAWLGVARQYNGSVAAQEAFERAVGLDQQSASIKIMYGTYLQQTGKFEQARNMFLSATRIEPQNPAWWLALAGATAHFDLAEALNDYIKAVNLASQQAGYWYALAAFCVEQNSYIEDYGLNAALKAYALDPKNTDYMDMLGRAQMAAGLPDAAEVMIQKAIAQSSQSGQVQAYHFHLSLLYLQTNQPEKAKSELEKVLELDLNGPYGAQAKKLMGRYFP